MDGYCARFLTLFCGTVEEITSTNCKGLTACLHVSMDDYKLVHRMVLKNGLPPFTLATIVGMSTTRVYCLATWLWLCLGLD